MGSQASTSPSFVDVVPTSISDARFGYESDDSNDSDTSGDSNDSDNSDDSFERDDSNDSYDSDDSNDSDDSYVRYDSNDSSSPSLSSYQELASSSSGESIHYSSVESLSSHDSSVTADNDADAESTTGQSDDENGETTFGQSDAEDGGSTSGQSNAATNGSRSRLGDQSLPQRARGTTRRQAPRLFPRLEDYPYRETSWEREFRPPRPGGPPTESLQHRTLLNEKLWEMMDDLRVLRCAVFVALRMVDIPAVRSVEELWQSTLDAMFGISTQLRWLDLQIRWGNIPRRACCFWTDSWTILDGIEDGNKRLWHLLETVEENVDRYADYHQRILGLRLMVFAYRLQQTLEDYEDIRKSVVEVVKMGDVIEKSRLRRYSSSPILDCSVCTATGTCGCDQA